MYIVTGGAGFIGSAMIWKLNEENIDDILVVDNLASSEKWRNLVNRRYTDYMHRDEFRKMLDANRLAPQGGRHYPYGRLFRYYREERRFPDAK